MLFQIRDFGEFLRGDATPFQLLSATILAGILSFLPGFTHCPGLFIAAALLFLILNTNFFVAGFVAAGGKLLGLLLQPVSFELGRQLIDERAIPLFTRLINGPVSAWCGFENYVATGSLILGAAYGIVTGLAAVLLLSGFRRQMMRASESGSFQKLAASPLSRALTWTFFGEKAEDDWKGLAARKIGKPVRVTGVIFATLVVLLLVAAPRLLPPSWLARLACAQLAPWNGATVDIAAVEADPAGGKLAISELALCDPSDLNRNTFAATRLEANLSTADLLARKYALDRLEISGAQLGSPRMSPGRKAGAPPKLSPTPDTSAGGEGDPTFSIDGSLKQAEEWKARLAQVKKWIEKLSPPPQEKPSQPGGETLEDRLRRQARELGYAAVVASHRIQESPRFTIRELLARDVRIHQLPGEILDVRGSLLSTQPQLLPGPSQISAESRSGKLGLSLTLDRDAGPLAFHYDELPVDTVKGWMSDPGRFPFVGGHFKLTARGTLQGTQIQLPIQVTPVGSQLRIAGALRPAPQVPFTVVLSGSLDNPKIRPQLKDLLRGAKDQLLQQGTEAVKTKLQEKVGEKLKGLLQRP